MYKLRFWFRVVAAGAVSHVSMFGCTGRDVASSSLAEIRDSAGITIVTTPGEAARAPLAWSVAADPELVIGREGTPEYEFNRIEGLQQSDDGRIVVVDAGSAEIRFYDHQGQFVARLGGRGSGPGEFQQPVLVPRVDADTVLIFDARLNRFTFVDVENHGIETVSPAARVVGTPLGFVGGRSLMRSAPLSIGGGEGARPPSRAVFTLIDPATAEGDTIAAFEGPQLYSAQVRNDGPRLTTGVPFKIFPSGSVGAHSSYVHGARAPEIIVTDSAGKPRRILRVGEPPREVTDEMVARLAARYTSNDSDPSLATRWEQIYHQMPLPEVLPTFHRILIDGEGWVWAEIYRPERDPLFGPLDPSVDALWIIFDQDGTARGAVELPHDLYVHQIGQDFVLGVEEDALGVETIRRYRMDRP